MLKPVTYDSRNRRSPLILFRFDAAKREITMAQVYTRLHVHKARTRRHVKLAAFGCLRCEHLLYAPAWYELGRDVDVCACEGSKYKKTDVRVPSHIQSRWDAQYRMVHISRRRRLKRRAPPKLHVPPTDLARWEPASEDADVTGLESLNRAPDEGVVHQVEPGTLQRHAGSLFHACLAAIGSSLDFLGDVERDNKGKT